MNLKTILILTAFILGAFLFCLVIGYAGVRPFDSLYAYIVDLAGRSNVSLESVTSNPAALATTAVAGVTAAVGVAAPLLSKLNSAKTAAQAQAETAKTTITGLTDTAKTATETLKTTELKLTDTTAQLTAAKTEIENLKTAAQTTPATLEKMQVQVDEIRNLNQNFVKGLMQAANGALIANPLDGKTYSVLKVPPEIRVP